MVYIECSLFADSLFELYSVFVCKRRSFCFLFRGLLCQCAHDRYFCFLLYKLVFYVDVYMLFFVLKRHVVYVGERTVIVPVACCTRPCFVLGPTAVFYVFSCWSALLLVCLCFTVGVYLFYCWCVSILLLVCIWFTVGVEYYVVSCCSVLLLVFKLCSILFLHSSALYFIALNYMHTCY